MRSKRRKRLHRYLSMLLVFILVFSMVSSGGAREAGADETGAENTTAVSEPVKKEEPSTEKEEASTEKEVSEEKTETKEESDAEKEKEAEQPQASTEQTATTEAEAATEEKQSADSGKKAAQKKQEKAKKAEKKQLAMEQQGRNANLDTSLNNFVISASVVNEEHDDDGKLVLRPGAPYSFRLEFKEEEEHQFNKTAQLVYEVPQQLVPVNTNGTFNMKINSGETKCTVEGNTYRMEGNKIYVNFNQDDPDFQHLNNVANAEFYLEFSARLNQSAEEDKLQFGTKVEKEFTIDRKSSLTINKTGQYNKEQGKFEYWVEVHSIGNCTNVVVKDSIEGSLLTYDNNVEAGSNVEHEGAIGTVTTETNGFTYTIPSMSHDETVTLHYTATVDYSKLNGNTFTDGQTGNTVTAKGEETKEVTEKYNYDNQTAYDDGIQKEGKLSGEIQNGKQLLDWKITINPDARVYVGGSDVTDTLIQNDKVPMKYAGAGIKVKKYDAGKQLKEEKLVAWNELKSYDEDSGWTYTLPDDGKPYKYEITYQTEADVSQTISGQNYAVKNKADYGDKSSGEKSVGVKPSGENVFEINKQHTSVSSEEVSWKVDVIIPKCGFNESFQISDVLPSTWNNEKQKTCKDTYIENSLQIKKGTTEIPATYYSLVVEGKGDPGKGETIKINFDFTRPEVRQLFQPSTEERTLTLIYETKPSKEWPESEVHTNTVTATGDGLGKSAKDSFTIGKAKLKKAYDSQGMIDNLPAFKYVVYLENVNSSPVTVKDTFNPDLFEVVVNDKVKKEYWMYVGAGDNIWAAQNGLSQYRQDDEIGGTISYDKNSSTFTIIPRPKIEKMNKKASQILIIHITALAIG